MPVQQPRIFKCGQYHPYRLNGTQNPKCDRLSKLMMDLKDPENLNHNYSVKYFSDLILECVEGYALNDKAITQLPFTVTIAPSHSAENLSPALVKIAMYLCEQIPFWSYTQLLRRHTTVPSSHREGGQRNMATHLDSIAVDNSAFVQNRKIIILDDVTTSGSTLSACYHLLRDHGAGVLMPLALLETTF